MVDGTADLEALRRETGLPLVETFAFGDSPAMADALLAFVRRGTKRATVWPVEDDTSDAVGEYSGILDGNGKLAYVMKTTHLERGRLGEVTPAFAWDEGEDDGTLEAWLDGHRAFFRAHGFENPDRVDVMFERFRIVWPEPDGEGWLTPTVRPLRHDERDWYRSAFQRHRGTLRAVSGGVEYDVGDLPSLVHDVGGERTGVATFRPRPGGITERVTVDAFSDGYGTHAALTEGLNVLADRHGWRELLPPTLPPPR